MQLTLSQAARVTGKSKSSLRAAIKDGVISASRRGNRSNSPFQIELSELTRVFPAVNPQILSTQNIFSQHSEHSLNSFHQPTDQNQRRDNTTELAVLRERTKHYEDRIRDLKDQLSEAKMSAEEYKQRFLEADTKLLGVLKTLTPNQEDGVFEHSPQISDITEQLVGPHRQNDTMGLNSSTEINKKQKFVDTFVLTDAHRVAPRPKKPFYTTNYRFKLDELKFNKSNKDTLD